MHNRTFPLLRTFLQALLILGLVLSVFRPQTGASAAAILKAEPLTWNVIGLDSNNVSVGPNHFPVGARVCNTGDTPAFNVQATFAWDSANALIDIRPGTSSTLSLASLAAGACTDLYFEVQVTRSAAAYDTTRRYHIAVTADGGLSASTPTPRELYVEHLVSQNRNTVSNVLYGTSLGTLVSVANGGSMSLAVGNTYYIRLVGATATNGYEQIESFINFPNTVFQILSVETTYTAGPPSTDTLYEDACTWENNPNSPNYRSCLGVGKAGGGTTVTYQVRILSVGSSNPQPLSTLLYDFSGSSYHYNSDYGVSTRYAYILDPSAVTITKNFSPDPTTPGGVSTLTFTLTNPTPTSFGGLNFTDTFPTSPGAMVVAGTPNASTSGCGSPTFSPSAGAGSISFSNGSIAPNSTCSIKVNVTVPVTGTYTNTSSHLFIGSLDTGNSATDTLTVNTAPPGPSAVCGLSLAQWTFPSGFSTASPSPSSGSGSASPGTGIVSTSFSEGTNSWGSSGEIATGATIVTSNNDYVQFQLNTTGYSSVSLTFDAARKNIPNSPRGIAVYYSTGTVNNPEPNSPLYTNATALPLSTTAFSSFGAFTFAPTSNTTYVRIYFFNAGNTSAGSDIFVDNVTFTGCAVPTPPTLTKTFLTNPISVNGTSTLSFTLSNSNSVSLTGVTFADALPAGLQVASTPAAGTTCGGTPTWAPAAGDTMLTFGSPAGATINANGSCTASVTITGTASGSYQNISGFISSTNGGTNTGPTGIASASLTVLKPPAMTKLFAPNPILSGGTSTLTFTITNPNLNDALTGISFTDTYPSGLENAATPAAATSCSGGTLTAAAGGNTVSLSGATVAAGGSCTVSVNVTAAAANTYVNTSGAVISGNGGTGNTASDSLTVNAPNPSIALMKQVSTETSGPWTNYVTVDEGSDVYYRFTVENTGDVPLSPIGVQDPPGSTLAGCSLPGSLSVAVAGNDNHIATCIVGPVMAEAGSNVNTAIASGTFGGTAYESEESSAEYATPGLTLAKSATETSFTAEGDLLHYSYLVTNSGFAPLFGPVTVTDDKVTVTCPAVGTGGDSDEYLDPGESLICSATYTVTAGDVTRGSVTNTAIATVEGVNSNQDSHTINILRPDLVVTKTNDVSSSLPLNGTFNWTITLTNSGIATALFADGDVILMDTLPGTDGYYPDGALPVTNGSTPPTGTVDCSITGIVLTCAASGAVTLPVDGSFSVTFQVMPSASGPLANTATADPDNHSIEINETNNTGSDTVTVLASPLIEKQFVPETIFAGETSTLTLQIFNANPATALNGVAFTDSLPAGLLLAADVATPQCGGTVSGTAGGNVIVLAGGSIPANSGCTITATVTTSSAGSYVNTTGNVSSTNGGTGNTATYTLNVNPRIDLSLDKQVSDAAPDVGETVTFTLTIANAGPSAATNIDVTDAIPGGYTYISASITGGDARNDADPSTTGLTWTINSLTSGSSISLTYNATVLATGPYANYAEIASHTESDADSTPGNSSTNEDDDDTVAVTPEVTIDVSLDKQVSTSSPPVGSTVTFTLAVANAGPSAATNVSVVDALPSGYSYVPASIAGGDTWDDANPSTTGLEWTLNTLAFGESVNLTYQATVLETGVYDNYAQVSAHNEMDVDSTPGDDSTTEDDDDIVVVTPTQSPAMVLDKTASLNDTVIAPGGVVNAGDTISYTFSVENTGNVTITNIVITDLLLPSLTCTIASLAPGANTSCSAANNVYTLTQSDIDTGSRANSAVAAGKDPLNNDVTDMDTESVTLAQTPILTVAKSVTEPSYANAGDVLHYSYLVANSGNVTLSGPLTITDDKSIDEACPVTALLAPGASITCSATYTVTALDVANASITNIASAHGSFGGNAVDSATDSETVTLAAAPSMILTKAAALDNTVADPDGEVNAGDTITYTFSVQNTGNVTISNITVTDPLLPGLICSIASLAPGANQGCSVAENLYILTQADIDNGSRANTATATGQDPDDIDVTDSDTETTTLAQSASLALTKTSTVNDTVVAPDGMINEGDTITYSFSVENTGNVTITGIDVTDPMLPGLSCSIPNLAPGATESCTASNNVYTLTQADIDAGSRLNTATAAGVDPDENDVSDTDAETTTLTQSPSLNVVKQVSADNSTWNDTSIAVRVGDTVYFRVRVANTGNTTLTGLTVDDGMAACTLTRGTDITGDNDNSFESAEEWLYTCLVTAVSGTVNNTAAADSNETSQDSDSASYTAGAALVADPALSKAGSPSQASVGETVTFTITATNSGNAPAPDVVITDPLPAMFDVTAISVTGAPLGTLVNVTPAIGTGPAPYTVIVTLGGDLAPGDLVTITIVTFVNDQGNPPINNTASLTTSSLTDVDSNNSASVSIITRSSSRRKLPDTGFAKDSQTVLPIQPSDLAYASTDVMLEIPGLGVKIPIVGVPKKNGTWNVSWLGNQAGWLEGSAFPSWTGNSVLTSHVYLANGLPGPFVNLNKLKYGDQVILHVYGQTYTFAVQTNRVVEPTDASVLKHEEKPLLTLVTCKDYDEKTNSYLKRVVVRAVLVSVE